MLNRWKIVWVASCALATVLGCKNDDAAIRVLQDMTAGMADQVDEHNDQLVELEEELMTCQANVAQAKKLVSVITARDVTHDVPTHVGEPSLESLETYKAALDKTLAKQETALERLRDKEKACSEELAALNARPTRRRAVAKRPEAAPTKEPSKEEAGKSGNNIGAAFEFDRASRKFNLGGSLK